MDISKDMTVLKQDLLQAQGELESGDCETSAARLDQTSMSRQDAENLIMECVNSRQYTMVLQLNKNLRYILDIPL